MHGVWKPGGLNQGLMVTACIFEDLIETEPFAPIHTDLITLETEMWLFAAAPNQAGSAAAVNPPGPHSAPRRRDESSERHPEPPGVAVTHVP
jgi:hypothetical protein